MKRIIIPAFLVFIAISCSSSQVDGTWNSASATYTNEGCHVTWKLISEVEWEERPALTESTVFKVREKQSGILVSLVIVEGGTGSLSEFPDVLENPTFRSLILAQAVRDSMVVESCASKPGRFRGLPANRIKIIMSREHPEVTVYAVNYMYQIIYNNYVYTLGFLAPGIGKEDFSNFALIVDHLLDGFSLD